MRFDKTHFIVFIVGAVLGLICGFFSAKAIYDKPITESATRDTVTDTVRDTIPRIVPVTRTEIKEVNRLHWWQKAMMWIGGVLLVCGGIMMFNRAR